MIDWEGCVWRGNCLFQLRAGVELHSDSHACMHALFPHFLQVIQDPHLIVKPTEGICTTSIFETHGGIRGQGNRRLPIQGNRRVFSVFAWLMMIVLIDSLLETTWKFMEAISL